MNQKTAKLIRKYARLSFGNHRLMKAGWNRLPRPLLGVARKQMAAFIQEPKS